MLVDMDKVHYAVDSREVRAGGCFVALRGNRVDGHAYLEEAAARGATSAIVEKGYAGRKHGLKLHRVANPLFTLQELAQKKVADFQPRVIAVVGSIGKTTTKELLAAFLATTYSVAATPGNANSQIGLPLTILNHCRAQEIWVLEMGISQPGEMERLACIAPPEGVVVTKIAHSHVENFGSLQAIAEEKAKVINSATKWGVLSEEDPYTPSFAHRLQGEKIYYKGRNAAREAARYLRVKASSLEQALQTFSPIEGRCSRVEKEGITWINDAYNACPEAVLASLENLPAPKQGGRRIFVFGAMVELGEFSGVLHAKVGEAASQSVDQLFCLGEEAAPTISSFASSGKSATLFHTKQELLAALQAHLQPHDVVLLKGRNSLQMWSIIDDFVLE